MSWWQWALLFLLVACFGCLFLRRPHIPHKLHKLHKRYDEELARLHTISSEAATSMFIRPIQLLEMGDLYVAGVYPNFVADHDTARALYVRAATQPETRGLAMAKLESVKHVHADVHPETRAPPLPDVHATRALRATLVTPTVVEAPRTNLQSVHDHGVTKSVRKTLNSLPNPSNENYEDTATEIRQHILDKWTEGDELSKHNALRVVDSIMDTDATYALVSVGSSEKQAMQKVWSTISSVKDPLLQQNIKETFMASLADAVVTEGVPVCPTGRIVKMVSSLDGTGVGDVADTVDMYTVRQELMNLAAKTRDAHDDETQTKNAFRKEAQRVYIDGLGLAKDVVEPLILEMEQGF